MKDSNRYRLKIKVYTKKHKDTYKNDKTKLRIMLMGERELKECNPGGTHKTSTLFVIFFFFNQVENTWLSATIVLYTFSYVKYI